jgi:hypothetical protein
MEAVAAILGVLAGAVGVAVGGGLGAIFGAVFAFIAFLGVAAITAPLWIMWEPFGLFWSEGGDRVAGGEACGRARAAGAAWDGRVAAVGLRRASPGGAFGPAGRGGRESRRGRVT